MITDAEQRRHKTILRLLSVPDERLDDLARAARDEARAALGEAESCWQGYLDAMAEAEEAASELRGYL